MLSNTSLYASSMQYYFLQMNVRYTINTFDTRYRNIEIKCQIRSLNVLCRYRFSSFLVMDTIFLLKYRHWFILPVLHENKDIHVLCRQHCALPIRKFLVIKNRFHIDVMTFQGFIKHKNNDSFEKGICNTICSSIPYDIILYINNNTSDSCWSYKLPNFISYVLNQNKYAFGIKGISKQFFVEPLLI